MVLRSRGSGTVAGTFPPPPLRRGDARPSGCQESSDAVKLDLGRGFNLVALMCCNVSAVLVLSRRKKAKTRDTFSVRTCKFVPLFHQLLSLYRQ